MKSLTTARVGFASLAVVAGLSGCGGVEDEMTGGGGSGSGSGELDTTAPTVVATTPTDGATGQAGDVSVSIQFSEPMDQASVEGTLDTADLGDVTLAWNADGDTITITPNAPLAYAEGIGDDPSATAALAYQVVLSDEARDLAGNPIAAAAQIEFKTLKAMASVYPLIDSMSRTITPAAFVYDANDPLVVGDDGSNTGMRSTVTFDLAALPAAAVGIAAATLATRQQIGDLSGNPFGELGTSIRIDHVTFGPMLDENAINAAFNSSQTSLVSLDGFCIKDQVVIEFDLTAELADDLADRGARGNRSQFLLRFPTPVSVDGNMDRAVISRDLMELQVTYLAP